MEKEELIPIGLGKLWWKMGFFTGLLIGVAIGGIIISRLL